jgi:hypothetical protein
MAGTSQLVSKNYMCNISCTVVFSKIYGEEMLRFTSRDYSSLNRCQANWVLISTLTLCNLLFCNNAPTKWLEGRFPSAG